MNKKVFISITAIAGLALLFSVVVRSRTTPVTLSTFARIRMLSIDDKINEAQLIMIGTVKITFPSRWNAPDGNDSKYASPEQISRADGLFTDSIFSIDQILKGNIEEPVVRVRTFTGEIETVRWINNLEPSFVSGQTYLLFLEKDTGASTNVDPGHYISVNSARAVYETVDGKAKSLDDEWVLEDLINYIQSKLSETESPPPTSTAISTPDAATASSEETSVPTP